MRMLFKLMTPCKIIRSRHEKFFSTSPLSTSFRARVDWFMLTGGILGFAFVTANAIPFFAAFQVRALATLTGVGTQACAVASLRMLRVY